MSMNNCSGCHSAIVDATKSEPIYHPGASIGSQEVAPIDKLPEELIVRVLEFLDGSSLRNCTLVCKRWNEIIGRSSTLMKKLPLKVSAGKFPDPEDLLRDYHTIKCSFESHYIVDLGSPATMNFEKLLSQQGRNLRVFELKDCTFDRSSANALNKVFESLPMLEELKFEYLAFAEEPIDDKIVTESLKSHSLPRLKSANLRECASEFLRLIETNQFTSLKIEHLQGRAKRASAMIDFLVTQNEIEKFEFRSFVHSGVENPFDSWLDVEKLRKINFPLKKLSICNLDGLLKTEENILIFLNKFTDTLEELVLSGLFLIPYLDSVFEMVFKKFLKLKTLDVVINYAPTKEDFYYNLHPNLSIQKLIIRGYPIKFEPLSLFEGFIGNLPKVKELIVEDDLSQEQMTFIANNLKIQNLHLGCVSKQLFNGISMPSVQIFSIRDLRPEFMEVNDWEAITAAMPNVETFSVHSIFYSKVYGGETFNNCFEIITKNWLQLKHIKLGEGFVAKKLVFDQMLGNCCYLKTLEILEDAFGQASSLKEEVLRDFKINNLSLIIDSEDGKWISKEWKYEL